MAKKKKTRAKRRVLGFMGKMGAAVMVVPPLAGSAIMAANAVDERTSATPVTLMGQLTMGFQIWVNNLASGFSFPRVFDDVILKKAAGGRGSFTTTTNVPQNAWWITTGLGGIMLLQDRVAAFLLKRPVKLMGTNFVLTGN